jgi:predicted phage tail protein
VSFDEHERQVARLGEAHNEIVRMEAQARIDAAAIREAQRQVDESADTIRSLGVQIELLERRIAEAKVDPATVEWERKTAELGKPPARQRRRPVGKAS